LSKDFIPHYRITDKEEIQFELTSSTGYGVLLWHGQTPVEVDPDDYMSIGFTQGKLEFRWDLGSGAGNVISTHNVTDGKKHKVCYF